jgi:hypothetical protein
MSIRKAAQRELSRHSWEHFVDNPPSIAQGGRGVVVPGCPACNKVINTTNGFMEHLANDVLPGILETAFATATKFVYCRECEAAVEYEKSVLEPRGAHRFGDRVQEVPLSGLYFSGQQARRGGAIGAGETCPSGVKEFNESGRYDGDNIGAWSTL